MVQLAPEKQNQFASLPPEFYQVSHDTLHQLMPPPRADPIEWVPDNVHFPAESSAVPRGYDFFMFPYHKGVWEAFMDPDIRMISMRWATQTGKTTLLQAFVAYVAVNDPAPAIWGAPDEALLKRSFKRKLYPMLLKTDCTAELLPARHRRSSREIDLKNMILYGAWSGSASQLGDISARYVLANEIDKWSRQATFEGDAFSLILERVKAFRRYKVIRESTPTEFGYSRIDTAISESDDAWFYVPCPHCGDYIELRFEDINIPRSSNGKLCDARTAKKESRYICQLCKEAILHQQKLPALRKGVWLKAGQQIDSDGVVSIVDPDIYVPNTHAGFSLGSIYSPMVTFGEIAEKWVNCLGDFGATKAMVNGWLGRSYKPKQRSNTEEGVLLHRGIEEGLDYPRDKCPEFPIDVILAVDVQEDCLWYSVWAFCLNKTRYLLRHGQLPRHLDSVLSIAGMIFETTDGRRFKMTLRLMDSGYRTKEVYDWCRRHGFLPTKGDKVHSKGRSLVRYGKQGSGYQDDELLLINVSPFKDQLADLIQNRNNDDEGAWRLHRATDVAYAEQITAEKRMEVINKVTGVREMRWMNHGGKPNHFWDLAVMAEAGSTMSEMAGTQYYTEPEVSYGEQTETEIEG